MTTIEGELFLESHKVLMDLVKYFGTPTFIAKTPEAAEAAEAMSHAKPGTILMDRTIDELQKISLVSKETQDLLLRAFCVSHTKLK